MARRSSVRLSRVGRVVCGGGLLFAVAAAVSGNATLMVVALLALVAVVLAVVAPHLGSPIELRRQSAPRLVGRGQVFEMALMADATRATPAYRVIDHLADQPISIDMPPATPGAMTVVRYRVQPLRRGPQRFGPLLHQRRDPFGLATRTITHTMLDDVVVHPRIHTLRAPDPNQAPTRRVGLGDDPHAEFRSLRAYSPGDDLRLVHWLSSARSPTLLVRDRDHTTQPTRLVLLDTVDRSATENLFEEAVEVAASLVCASLEQQISVTARTRDRAASGRPAPIRDRREALTLFALVGRTAESATIPVSSILTGCWADQVVLVAGAASPLIEQLAVADSVARRLVVIRLLDGSAPAPPLAVPCIDITAADEFTDLWSSGAVTL
jgi:uncharacterized protein (DUF58 family)